MTVVTVQQATDVGRALISALAEGDWKKVASAQQDASCYPTVVDNPVGSTPEDGG